MPLTVGTAGHIDHGKTWLVRALTGKDTDRLPEERARGISIDLGYAPLELPDGRRLSLVDVPGHERFVRTMIAGASGIDLFLLVIDAQEGARPQTHEHLAVLRLLGVERGVVAVTKADTVDPETLELAVAEAQELVPGAEVVAVSAKTGSGLDELRAALARVDVGERSAKRATRLYVDRVFTLQGIGTVATGTLWSGSIGAGDVLRVEPGGRTARVRSVQVHDAPVERAAAGQRVAVNLPDLDRRRLARGDVLVEPGHYPVSYRLDVRLTELAETPAAVTAHVGTKAVPARLAREGPYAQLRLAEPVVAARGDRIVLRTNTTVAGGTVLDPAPPRRLDAARLAVLERGDPSEIVRATVHAPVTGAALQARGLLAPAELAAGLTAVRSAGDYVFSEPWLDELGAGVRARLAERARTHPLDPGIQLGELLPAEPWAPVVLNLLGIERRGGKGYLPGAAAKLGEHADAAAELEARLAAEEIVKLDDRALAGYLEEEGRLRRVGDGFAVSTELYERGRELLPTLREITIRDFRDALGVGRRTAQLLLERYDGDGLTRRIGDVRVLRRAAR
ncbi:MAG TPA: selenocysteine-specific translation elongation factor [Gaiellaceae bacterium]|nr:selenocysteine-specific translation elongation factor [Gaiellaceae bacterium]